MTGLESDQARPGAWVTIVPGAIVVICALTFRRGVVGGLGRLVRKPL